NENFCTLPPNRPNKWMVCGKRSRSVRTVQTVYRIRGQTRIGSSQSPALVFILLADKGPSCLNERSAVNASSFEPNRILSIADRGIAWMERPVHFVSACSATTVDGLGLCAALGFGDHDTEVSAAPGAGSGEVYSHRFKLTLGTEPYNLMKPPVP